MIHNDTKKWPNYISYRPTNLSNGRFAHLSRWLHFSSFLQVQFFSFLIELENLPIEVFYFFYDDLRISCVKFSLLHWNLALNKDMEIFKPFLIAGILRIKSVFSRSAACWRYSNLWFWCCSNWQSRHVKTPHVLTFSKNCARKIFLDDWIQILATILSPKSINVTNIYINTNVPRSKV